MAMAGSEAPGLIAYRDAMAHLQKGQFEAGAAALQSVLDSKLLPSYLLPDAHANLGTALSSLNRHEQAIRALQTAVNANPGNSYHRYNLALSFAETGNAEAAESQYRSCLQIPTASADNSASCYNNLGNLLVTGGRRDEALACFRGAVAANPKNAMGHNNLANLLRDGSDDASLRAAGRAYAEAIRLAPRYLEAYKNLGNLLKERASWRDAAIRAYRVAIALLPAGEEVRRGHRARAALPISQPVAGWQLGAGRELLMNLGDVLQWTGRNAAANATFALGVARGVWHHPQQRPSHWVSGLRARPWWTPAEANPHLVQKLLAPSALSTLRRDGLALLGRGVRGATGSGASRFLPYQSAALAGGSWSDVTLALSGSRQPGASLAPRSYALYESLGEDATTMVTGSAYFSVLSPGARLKAHCGPTNVRLRIHVGLLVAEGAGLRVGNETRAWAEDEVLIFDDSFEHAVWNDSNDTRLVFIVDVWHPQLRTDEERTRALDGVGKRRYERATAGLRYGRGLPEEADLVAERRVRTIY